MNCVRRVRDGSLNLTDKQVQVLRRKGKVKPQRIQVPQIRKMDDDMIKKFKENLMLKAAQIDIRNAEIEKSKPKNCSAVNEKVQDIEARKQIVMDNILTIGGRVEIKKINQVLEWFC